VVTKKQQFPIQIFFFFEKINPGFFTSKILRANTFLLILPAVTLKALAILFKNELFLSPSYVVDASAVDSGFFKKNFPSLQSPTIFYIFYFFFLKLRVISLFSKNEVISSIDAIYPSANWLEREFSEMFGINLFSKVDARNLLLDYSRNEAPLLKSFPTTGLMEVHYSILAESVIAQNASAVEL
jgi:NADH:ubiquinone oxidoreductase subunit C